MISQTHGDSEVPVSQQKREWRVISCLSREKPCASRAWDSDSYSHELSITYSQEHMLQKQDSCFLWEIKTSEVGDQVEGLRFQLQHLKSLEIIAPV